MATRFNTVQIGSSYLSSDGLSSGVLCKTEIEGLNNLSLDYAGVTVVAIDGTPYIQTQSAAKGQSISIRVLTLPQTLFETLTNAIDTAVQNSTAITVKIDGSTGNFLLTCLPQFPAPVEFSGDFNGNRLFDVTFNFIVQARGHYISPAAGVYTQAGNAVTLT